MPHQAGRGCRLAAALLLIFPVAGAYPQAASDSLPNPYQAIENWAKLPEGRTWGAAAGTSIDRKGNLWVFERCGANTCAGRSEAPILEFDPSGRLVKSFGGGMFVFPHGLFVDKDDNVWVTDADGKDGKGQQVVKFSSEGRVLMTLGKPGVAGDGPDTFNRPSGVCGRSERRHFRRGWAWREFQRADRETLEKRVAFICRIDRIVTFGDPGNLVLGMGPSDLWGGPVDRVDDLSCLAEGGNL